MYFIVSSWGEATTRKGTAKLRDNDFFSKIALVYNGSRSAAVKLLTRSKLLILEARDFNRLGAAYASPIDLVMGPARRQLNDG